MTGGSPPQGQLTGIDLGAYWSNVQLVAVDLFDNKVPTNKDEMLVQNTVDHHLYEWWINSQNQLTGIDLGPYWSNVQLIGHAHYNESVPFPYRELLVRNTTDGQFSEWWIANNQLQGAEIGSDVLAGDASSSMAAVMPPLVSNATAISGSGATSAAAPTFPPEPTARAAPTMASPPIDATLPSPLSASTSLLVQAMASFGTSNAVDNSRGAVLPAGVAQLSDIVAPIDQRVTHG